MQDQPENMGLLYTIINYINANRKVVIWVLPCIIVAVVVVLIGKVTLPETDKSDCETPPLREPLQSQIRVPDLENNTDTLAPRTVPTGTAGVTAANAQVLALQAVQKAKESSNDNPELAAIYYLNAFNTDPTNAGPLLSYVDLLTSGTPDTENIAQAIAVLDTALYRVHPDFVHQVYEKKQTLQASQESLSDTTFPPTTTEGPLEEDVFAQAKTLLDVNLDTLLEDQNALDLHLANLMTTQEVIDLKATSEEELAVLKSISEHIEIINRTKEISVAATRGEAYTERIKELIKSNDIRQSVFILNAAENSVAQGLSLADASIPVVITTRLNKLLDTMEMLSAELGKKQSLPHLEAIREECRKVKETLDKKNAGLLQDQCTALEKALRRGQGYLAKIGAPEPYEEGAALLTDLQKMLSESRRLQIVSYNRWALECCHGAIKVLSGLVKTSNDAVRAFEESGFAKVDQSLLSPEVSRIYSETLGKLTAEMTAGVVAEHEKKLVLADKKRLEEF